MVPTYPELQGSKIGPFQFQTKIVWFNAIGFLAMHLIGLYGIYLIAVKAFNFQFASLIWCK